MKFRIRLVRLAAAALLPVLAALHAGDVREFGAIGDGVTDDTAAIEVTNVEQPDPERLTLV
jgi:hypothetical protein